MGLATRVDAVVNGASPSVLRALSGDKCAFRFCSFHAPLLCASFRRRRLRIWRWQAEGAAPEKGDAADHADRDGGIAQAISTGTCISCSRVGCVKCSGIYVVSLDQSCDETKSQVRAECPRHIRPFSQLTNTQRNPVEIQRILS